MSNRKSNKVEVVVPRYNLDSGSIKTFREAAKASAEKVQSLADIIKLSHQNIFSSLTIPFDNLVKQQKDPFTSMDTSWIAEDMRWKAEKEAEEKEIRRLQLLKFRRELYPDKSLPRYDPVDCKIRFYGKTISIPANTNQEMLCKVVLRNRQSVARKWSWDELQRKHMTGYLQSTRPNKTLFWLK